MPTSAPVLDAYGKLVYFMDGREIVPVCVRDVSPCVTDAPAGGESRPPVASRQPFNLDACFIAATPLDLPERVVEVRA